MTITSVCRREDFEFAWSQGMVRHNFLRTGGAANAKARRPNCA